MVPCSNEGLTKVTFYFNTSSFIDGILYRREDTPFFYRNCTKDQSKYTCRLCTHVAMLIIFIYSLHRCN